VPPGVAAADNACWEAKEPYGCPRDLEGGTRMNHLHEEEQTLVVEELEERTAPQLLWED